MANIMKFVPKEIRLHKEQAETARQHILNLPIPEKAMEEMLVTIRRFEDGHDIEQQWNFNMISPKQCLEVWNAIHDHCPRPVETRRVFDLVITHLEPNTGIVTLTRDEIAELIDTPPRNVSTAMGWLEDVNVIVRQRVKVPGMRGPGKARYRLNPHIAWNGRLNIRKEQAEQQELPLLQIVRTEPTEAN